MKYIISIFSLVLTFAITLSICDSYMNTQINRKAHMSYIHHNNSSRSDQEYVSNKKLIIKKKPNHNDTNVSKDSHAKRKTKKDDNGDSDDENSSVNQNITNNNSESKGEKDENIATIFKTAMPILKKIVDTSSFLNTFPNNKSEYYQGSLILQIPDKSNDKFYFNVFNNFVYNNSSINQFIQEGSGNLNYTSKPEINEKKQEKINNTNLENAIKSIEKIYNKKIADLKKDYEEKLKDVKKNFNKDEDKIKDLNDKIVNLKNEEAVKQKVLQIDFDNKIKNLEKEKQEKDSLIEKKQKEINELKDLLEKKIKEFEKALKEKIAQAEEMKKAQEEEIKKAQAEIIKKNEAEKIKKAEEEEKKKAQAEKIKKAQAEEIKKKTEQQLLTEIPSKPVVKTPIPNNNNVYPNKEEVKEFMNKTHPNNDKTPKTHEITTSPKVYVPVKVVENVMNIKHDGNKVPIITSNSNKRPEDFPPLFCMDINGEEYKHFQMNFEKCKELNAIYLQFVMYLNGQIQDGEISCNSYDCKYEFLVKFKDDKTEFSINENINGQISIKKIGILTPSITKIHNLNIYKLEKNVLKDFITAYLYNFLIKIVRCIPMYAKYDMIFIADGESFDSMDEDLKNRFKKALLSLQNIDDRFLIEWNNIRIINKNEKKIKDYLLMKNIKNSEYKNMISLNLNENGLSIIGDENKNSDINNQKISNNIDNMFNNNDDRSKTSLEISKGNSIENLYSKDINLRTYSNSDSIRNIANNNEITNNYPSYYQQKVYDNPIKVKDYSFNMNAENEIRNPYISFNEKISRILKDPTILKLEEYIKKFKNQGFLSKYKNESEESDLIGKEIEDENLENKLMRSKNNLMKKFQKSSNFANDQTVMRFKQISSNKNSNEDHNQLFKNKTLIEEMTMNDKNNNENRNHLNQLKNEDFISENIKFCFNKEFNSKEFNITGDGDFFKCYELIENLNKNNIDALNKIDKLNNVLQNLKYNDKELKLEEYLERSQKIKSNKIISNETNTKKENSSRAEDKNKLTINKAGSELNSTVVEKNANNSIQNRNHSNIHKISLGLEFSEFKFLFYTKESVNRDVNHEVFKFEEMTKFENIKNKTINICSMTLSELKEHLKKFNIENISNVCLDSVFFVFYLEKLGIKDTSFLIMKAHKINLRNKKEDKLRILNLNIKLLLDFCMKDNHFFIISTFIFTFLCLVCIKSFREIIRKKVINWFIDFEKYYENIDKDNDSYHKSLLELYKVKNFFLYNENALLKQKYGKEFDPEHLSEEAILEDFKYYVKNSQELNQVILESRMTLADLKFNIIENISYVFIYLILSFTFGLFNFKFYETFGLFSLMLFNILFFIIGFSCYAIKKSYSKYMKKKELSKFIFL